MECKRVFYANYFDWSLTCHTWYACRCWTKLITQFDRNRGLRVKCSLFFPGFWKWAPKEDKTSLSVSVLDSKTKEDDKIVLQRVGFEISRERQGLLLQSRKMAKRWQSFWKTHWNYCEIEFHEFLSERSELCRTRSSQASDKFATGPAPYKNRTKDVFESLLRESSFKKNSRKRFVIDFSREVSNF